MLSVFDRIRNALLDGRALSKTELFLEANMPNTESNRALFTILIQNQKLIPMGKGRGTKYCLPLSFTINELPEEGEYKFSQKGNGSITFSFEQEEPITFSSYEECALFIKRRLTDG